MKELEEHFTVEGLSKSPAIFDTEKLRWMNGEYIRALSPADFQEKAAPWIKKALGDNITDEFLGKISMLIQPRTEVFGDIPEKIRFIKEVKSYEPEIYRHKKMKTDPQNSLTFLKLTRDFLVKYQQEWVSSALYEALCGLAAEKELKNSQILWPLRTALSGLPASPGGATELAELLGREETLRRIDMGIKLLEEV